ncbi:MAG: PAS domain S-box protein [Salinivirgaceae bacterium]
MKTALRILIVEDSEDDALLVLRQLKKGDFDIDFERVETAEKMKEALGQKTWDIVLSDFIMPHFNGLEALQLLKETGIDIPFIIISGTIGEETAVEAMKAGAHDYIMKNNLKRLLPAVERELRESNSRAERKLLEQKQKLTEEALLESEERYRLIAENTADTIVVLDLNLNIIYISPSVQNVRGYTAQEAMSQSLDQILTPDSYKKVVKVFSEQMILESSKNADPFRSILLELEEFHKNGSIIQVEIAVSTIRDKDLNPMRLLIVSRDITKRRQAEEKLQVLSHAVDQSPIMIVITDTNGTIEYVNHKFEEVTGYSALEAIGRNPRILKSGKMQDSIYEDMWDTIKANKIWYGKMVNKTKNGKFYWVYISISPITDKEGTISHYVGLAEDITEKKKTEEELIIAKEHAEESDRLKTAFLQNMSHEIRTPMNAIMGFSELMTLEYNNKNKLDEYSKIINHSCTDLLEIINGILDIAKI